MRATRQLIGLVLVLGLAARPATCGDLKDLYFGEALYHAYQGQYFDALQRLDTELAQYHVLDEPKLDTLHHHINDAEFSVGDFELDYRMHQRAWRAIKAGLDGGVDAAGRNEDAVRVPTRYFPKRARQYRDRVQRHGPFSKQALLRAGWAEASAQQYDRAVVA